MSMRIHVNYYCLNMALCRWSSCRSIQTCSYGGKDVITCYSSFWGIPCIHFRICCFLVINIGRTCFIYLAFDIAPEEVVWYNKIRQAAWARDIYKKKEVSPPGNVGLRTCVKNLCCVGSCFEYCCAWWQSAWSCCLAGKLVLNFKFCQVFLAHLVLPLAWSCSTRLFPLGVH